MINNLGENHFNEAQIKAITHGAGAMLVLAGPGSGKTTVITQRIKYLIEVYQVKPEEILVITFTKAAAAEMQDRFFRITNEKAYPVNFGTFHAVFFQILRHTYRFTGENIIRESDKYRLLTRVLEELPPEIASQEQKESEEADSSTERIQRILEEISKVKNSGISPEEVKSETVSQEEFIYIYQTYKRLMNQNRLIDFDDMVLLCRDLLMQRQETLQLWQERFSYILIDEFQDICPLQYEVVRLLAKPQNNLFIVGDDDQSIYGFRGASPEIMLHFQNDYPNAAQVLLNENYRSKRDIVDAAGRLIMHNKERFSKEIKAHNTAENSIRIMPFPSKQQQALNITELIKQYMQQEDAKYSDIAILYRTNNHTVYTANQLMKSSIPFIMKEKPKNIYGNSIAKDIVAYINYALKQDMVSDFYRIMNRPVRYIKRNTVPTKPFQMQELLQNNRGTDYVCKNVVMLYEQLHVIRRLTPFSAVNYIRKGIGYEEYLKKQNQSKNIPWEQVVEELDDLQTCAKDFETLEEWLEHIHNYDTMVEKALPKKNKQEDFDAVNIVTMHASKGLEWKIVILPDVNENVVPHKKAVTDKELEEERRMFYVAMTRAKEHLFIFYVYEKEAGNFLPSRFIGEITCEA